MFLQSQKHLEHSKSKTIEQAAAFLEISKHIFLANLHWVNFGVVPNSVSPLPPCRGGQGVSSPPGSEEAICSPPGLPPWRQPEIGEGGGSDPVVLASSTPPNVSGCSENEGENA